MLLAAIAAASLPATTTRAAESFDGCAGFIDSLPATIATQGVWCLRKDLSTAVASGAAISVAASNVTIDCNGYKVGGMAAGETSTTRGVSATGRQNATIRNCALRGFYRGIELLGEATGGHVVENNRVEQSLTRGIYLEGENNLVRGNRVFDTGGAPNSTASWGMGGSADFIGNTVSGGFAAAPSTQYVYGIVLTAPGTARDNIVRGLAKTQGVSGAATGIHVGVATGVVIRENHVSAVEPGFSGGYGIWGGGTASSTCMGNITTGYTATIGGCLDAGGNAAN
jgi:parallel beta-helix repeat protein